jgi:hypothetical protein
MKNLRIKVEIGKNICDAILYKGKPRAENPPKSWGDRMIIMHSLGNLYNPGWMEYYPKVDKYLIYRDGCFYPYVGKIEILDY